MCIFIVYLETKLNAPILRIKHTIIFIVKRVSYTITFNFSRKKTVEIQKNRKFVRHANENYIIIITSARFLEISPFKKTRVKSIVGQDFCMGHDWDIILLRTPGVCESFFYTLLFQ